MICGLQPAPLTLKGGRQPRFARSSLRSHHLIASLTSCHTFAPLTTRYARLYIHDSAYAPQIITTNSYYFSLF